MPYRVYKHSKFLHHLPSKDHISMINTGSGSIKTYKFIHIPLEIQNIGIQLCLTLSLDQLPEPSCLVAGG